MIENLNRLSFKEYGSIMGESLPVKSGESENKLNTMAENYTCFSTAWVYLERESGIPVIGISADELQTIRFFYLDKPVRLRPGMWYTVTILSEEGGVREVVPLNADRHQKPLPEHIGDTLFSPVLNIPSIYTLFYQEREKGFFFSGEQHKPYELVYVDKGQLHSVAGGQDYLLQQGEMMLYLPEQWHMQYAGQGYSVGFVTISFDMDCPYGELLANCRIPVGNEIKQILAHMLSEQDKNAFLLDDMLQSRLKQLIVLLLRQIRGAKSTPKLDTAAATTRENELVELAQRYINSHLCQRLTVEELARGINISSPYLSALFRKHLGMPPSRYIARVRLSESKRLIQDEKHNITETSQLLGYATVQHFSRCFKSEFGITPSEYARAMQ